MPRCDKNSCSFGDAGCPVTEERMLERLACAESGDIPSGRYKKPPTAMSAGMKAAKWIF
jgi:hypothetical protein